MSLTLLVFNPLFFILGVSVEQSSTKYYCENRKHSRYPWEERIFEEEFSIMEEVDAATDHNTKQQMATKSGYTGLTVLSRLFFMYGFNPLKDMVRDVMHVLPMNCGKKIFKELLQDIELRSQLEQRMSELTLTPEVCFIPLF